MELALIEQGTLSRLTEYVDLIESGELGAFLENVSGDQEFLRSAIFPDYQDGATVLVMAVLARYRDESLDLELALDFIRRIRCAGSTWKAVRAALIETIPCSVSMSSVNKDRLGQLLMAMILEGLAGEAEMDEWAGGWLAYYLQGHAWNRMIKDSPEWASSSGLAGSDFARSSRYELPAALALLGARKDAVPPWSREKGSVRSYAIKSRDPVLWYIVKRACSGSGLSDDEPDRLSEKVESLVSEEDDKVALRELLARIDSFGDDDLFEKALLFRQFIKLLFPVQTPGDVQIGKNADRLEDATFIGDVDSVRKLLYCVDDPEQVANALALAIALDNRDIFDTFVEHGVDVSQTFDLCCDEDGETIAEQTNLLIFASEGCLWAVKRLVELGVDPRYRDPSGETALSVAEGNEEKDIIRYLKRCLGESEH